MSRNKATTVSVCFVASCEANHIDVDLTDIATPYYNNRDITYNNHILGSVCSYLGVSGLCFSFFRTE